MPSPLAKNEEGAVRVPYVPQSGPRMRIAKQVAKHQLKPAVVADVVQQAKIEKSGVCRVHWQTGSGRTRVSAAEITLRAEDILLSLKDNAQGVYSELLRHQSTRAVSPTARHQRMRWRMSAIRTARGFRGQGAVHGGDFGHHRFAHRRHTDLATGNTSRIWCRKRRPSMEPRPISLRRGRGSLSCVWTSVTHSASRG